MIAFLITFMNIENQTARKSLIQISPKSAVCPSLQKNSLLQDIRMEQFIYGRGKHFK